MTSQKKLFDLFSPENYVIKLDIDNNHHLFSGTVEIKGRLAKNNDSIQLHAKDLTITECSIDGAPVAYSYENYDVLRLMKDGLRTGEHLVTLSFHGKITDSMHGLYPCYYIHDGKKKELFATQFESHHAREVFPCIDEPAAKATFDLELTTQPNQVVLSNMPHIRQSELSDRLVTTFDTTPRMSTYLLAFVVGDLHKKSAKTKSGVEVNVWATIAQQKNQLDFALQSAVETLEFYENYFETPYPLPKCDHVALPDFSSGAMENWGLITYREIALLADQKRSSIDHKHHVALVIAHELAHQWFGNLVTMKWWNDLWLNESFANMMEYLAIDALHPEWNIWLQFSTNEAIAALRRDSIDGVQAVQVDVDDPEEIDSLFDPSIVYAKGGRLLRMVQTYIGNDAFRKGLKNYFDKYSYQNTVGNDLWKALEESSGKKITYIMNEWISRPGYPVVTVEREKDSLSISQSQFFIGPHKETGRQWPIPLDADDNKAPKLLDNKKISYLSLSPIRLNLSDSAHFITHYDEKSMESHINNIRIGSFDTLGRLQVLHESTLLARGGVISSGQLIPILQSYLNEPHEAVWDIIAVALADLRKFVEDNQTAESKLRIFSQWLAKKQYKRLGWEQANEESENDTKLRSTIIGMTLYGENEQAIQQAMKLYSSTDKESIDTEIRSLVYSAAARYGDTTVVDELMNMYRLTVSSELRHDICLGVTSTKNPDKIFQLLEMLKDSSIIKPQDVYLWFALLIRGKDSRTITWKWLRHNWDWVETTYKGDKSYDDFPRYVSGALNTREQLEEYREFFEPKKNITSLRRVITVGLSEIEGRVNIIERDKETVKSNLLHLKLV